MSTPTTTVEIADALFCKSHLKEVCDDCNYDGREDNDSFYGLEFAEREGLEPQASANKDGQFCCKKHGSQTCNQCFGWKKQINRARTAAKKAGRK